MLLGATFTARPIHPFFEFQYTASHSLLLQLSEEIWHTYFYQVKPLANVTVLHSISTFLKTDSMKGKPVLNNLGSVRILAKIYYFNIIDTLIFFSQEEDRTARSVMWPTFSKYCLTHKDAMPVVEHNPTFRQGGGEVLLPGCQKTQGCKFLFRKPERFFANLLLKS